METVAEVMRPVGWVDGPTMSVPEVAAVLGISRALAYEACRAYRETEAASGIPNIQVGRRVLVLTDRLRELLKLDAVLGGLRGSPEAAERRSSQRTGRPVIVRAHRADSRSQRRGGVPVSIEDFDELGRCESATQVGR